MDKINEKEALLLYDKMAIKIANKFSNYYEFDDLYQVAKIGIVEGIRTYKKDKGTKLSTHIFNTILINVRKLYCQNSSIIFYPNYAKNKQRFISLEDSYDVFEEKDFASEVILNELIDNLFKTLTDKQKTIIKMKYRDGYSIKEIAEYFNCSHQNISSICKSAEKSITNKARTNGITF